MQSASRKEFVGVLLLASVFCRLAVCGEILDAASAGDLKKVKALLAIGANVNEKNGNGWTPLHAAAHSGNAEMAALLLSNKAAVNATGSEEHTSELQSL